MNDELKIKNNELGGKMNYRYRTDEEMKDSGVEWIGKIPKEWSIVKGKYLFKNKKLKNSGGLNNILSLTLNGVIDRDKNNFEGLQPESFDGYQEFNNDNLVFKLIDLENINTSRVGYVHKDGLMSPAYIRLEKNKDIHVKYYYYNYFDYYNQKIYNFLGSVGVRSALNSSDLVEMDVINNKLIEQEKIARFLDEKTAQFDSIISKKETLIEKLEEAKKSLISEVVTGKVKVVKSSDGYEVVERKKEEMKDSGVEWLGDIPKKWNVKKIKYISKIYRGKFNHRPRNDPEFYDGEYPFIQTGDVANSNMYITKYTQTLNKKGYSVSKEFPKGTLIMTIAANIGDIAILDFNACFPDSIVGFTPNNNIDIKFMYYIYSIMKEEFMSTAIINTQMNLNVERIENLFIVVPNIEKQKIIVDYIESKLGNIMNTINKVRQQIQKLKEAKQSLISEAVTGKIEILD